MQKVQHGVGVAVVLVAAFVANVLIMPRAMFLIAMQCNPFLASLDMAAGRTALRGRIGLVGKNKFSAIPCCFVQHLSFKFAEQRPMDSF